tara:strand:+ start:110 stop:397 length:288 start_codon:yes stop_codon:yes gene_type:complete
VSFVFVFVFVFVFFFRKRPSPKQRTERGEDVFKVRLFERSGDDDDDDDDDAGLFVYSVKERVCSIIKWEKKRYISFVSKRMRTPIVGNTRRCKKK